MACIEKYFDENGNLNDRPCKDTSLVSGLDPMPSRTDTVSFLQKVKNFAKASVNHVKAGMPMASDKEILRRHDICISCEFFKNNSCSKCGCPIIRDKKYISKLSWADSECPVGKWGKEV